MWVWLPTRWGVEADSGDGSQRWRAAERVDHDRESRDRFRGGGAVRRRGLPECSGLYFRGPPPKDRGHLKGLDLNGKEITVEGKDLLARAFCHEMDHLNGVFFLDHLSFIKRDIIKRKIRKLMKQGEWER